MKYFVLIILVGLLGAGCVSSTKSVFEKDITSGSLIDIVFSGTFDHGGNCHKYDQSGCDLYLASFDMNTGSVNSVDLLVGDEDAQETFPAIGPETEYVLFQRDFRSSVDIWYVVPETGKKGVLVEGAQAPYEYKFGQLKAAHGLKAFVASADLLPF